MFYDTRAWLAELDTRNEWTTALCVLTPSESKRLIAKAVAALPEVRAAMNHGRIVISRSTTAAFVAEELTKRSLDRYRFACGVIANGILTSVEGQETAHSLVLINGQPAASDIHPKHVLMDFGPDDVLIKSANAIDMQGNAGVLVYQLDGGSMGQALTVSIRGSHLLAPTGLEKLVPSVVDASQKCGKMRWRHSTGDQVGFLLLQNSQVITEIQAFAVLCQVRATMVAAGGVAGSEGAVVLALEGPLGKIDAAFAMVSDIKGEPAVGPTA